MEGKKAELLVKLTWGRPGCSGHTQSVQFCSLWVRSKVGSSWLHFWFMWAAVLKTANAFSFSINKEIGGSFTIEVLICWTCHHSACRNYRTKSWALEMERKHPAEKAERRDSSVTAARYQNVRGSGLRWTNLSALPSVLLWASLARAQASVVDILLQPNCLEDVSISQGLAERQFASTTHLVISVAGHDGFLPIPLLHQTPTLSFSLDLLPSALFFFHLKITYFEFS